MANPAKQYCKSLTLQPQHLKAFEQLFADWKSPRHLDAVASREVFTIQPDYLNILDAEEKLLDRMGDRCRTDSESSKTNAGYYENTPMCRDAVSIVREMYPDQKVYSKGAIYYPPQSYMGWHTNSNCTGKRVYISWSAESDKNFFRYRIGNKTTTVFESRGINAREFYVSDNPVFWHCVGCSTHRFSMGFLVI